MTRHPPLPMQIATLFRCLEACAALALLSWSSSRLPLAIRVSGDFLRHLSAIILSQRFVFLLGNAIILTLVAKSRNFSTSSSKTTDTASFDGGDLYDDFLPNAEISRLRILPSPAPSNREVEEEVVYEDKAVCLEKSIHSPDSRQLITSESKPLSQKAPSLPLRRPEADVSKISVDIPAGDGEEKKQKPITDEEEEEEETMSNEEFRWAIESFIAKQLRFQREESMSIMVTVR